VGASSRSLAAPALAFALAALAGCPRPAPPTPSPQAPPPRPEPPAGPAAPPEEAPPEAPAPPPDLVAAVDPGEPDRTAPSEQVDSLRANQQLFCAPNLALNLAGFVRVDGAQLARLDVASGPFSYELLAAPGQRLRAGHATFELDWLEGERGVRVAWRRRYPDRREPAPVIRPVALGEREPLRLAEMALYRLSDGRVVAVGSVLAGEEAPRVTLSIYPPGFEANPMQDYDRHFRARPGDALSGAQGRWLLARAEPGGEGRWGWVELAPAE